MSASAPRTASECIVAKQMIGELRNALSDLFSAGIAAEALHTLAASAAVEDGRLDRQITGAFAGFEHGTSGTTIYKGH